MGYSQIINPCSHDKRLTPLSLFRESEESKVISRTKKKRKTKPIEEEEKELLYCIYCLNLITSGDERFKVQGSHEHTFVNPAGITFNVGCFLSARGAVAQGKPTKEYTWFEGFQWSLAYCGECLKHIGWQYTASAQEGFWGLILNMLTTKKNIQ